MKLKQATLLAIIGLTLLIIPLLLYVLRIFGIFDFGYYNIMNLLSLIGYFLLFPFFITLYKNQK